MSEDNEARFSDVIGQILGRLIDACPVPLEVDAQLLSLQQGEFVKTPGFDGLPDQYHRRASADEVFLQHCLSWLESEGMIRRTIPENHYVATMQSLVLLDRLPDTLKKGL